VLTERLRVRESVTFAYIQRGKGVGMDEEGGGGGGGGELMRWERGVE